MRDGIDGGDDKRDGIDGPAACSGMMVVMIKGDGIDGGDDKGDGVEKEDVTQTLVDLKH